MFSQGQEAHGVADRASVRRPLQLTVICPGNQQGLQVVRQAAALAADLAAEIRLLVPIVTPYPLPLDRAAVDLPFVASLLKEECLHARVEVQIDLRLCRDPLECARQALPAESTVLLPRPRPWNWREKMFAHALRQDGHQLIVL